MTTKTQKYEVVRNRCKCHPETCSCDEWMIACDGVKHSTHFSLETAKEVTKALNAHQSQKTGLFIPGSFTTNSGLVLDWKIECDSLTDEDINTISCVIARRFRFGCVVGVPTGGLRLANALKNLVSTGPLLIVDDVLTTGGSMERKRSEYKYDPKTIGVVIFARQPPPPWIHAMFTLWR